MPILGYNIKQCSNKPEEDGILNPSNRKTVQQTIANPFQVKTYQIFSYNKLYFSTIS